MEMIFINIFRFEGFVEQKWYVMRGQFFEEFGGSLENDSISRLETTFSSHREESSCERSSVSWEQPTLQFFDLEIFFGLGRCRSGRLVLLAVIVLRVRPVFSRDEHGEPQNLVTNVNFAFCNKRVGGKYFCMEWFLLFSIVKHK